MANGGADPAQSPPLLVVAAALVNAAGEVLVQRRPRGPPHAGLWEFPGGKVEAGETPEQALIRELAEELAIVIDPEAAIPVTFASEPRQDRHLLLLLYAVRRWTGRPRPVVADAIAWRRPVELHTLAMPPADTQLIAALERLPPRGAGAFTP